MLTRIEEKQISVIEKLDNIKAWQKDHQENDIRQFKELNDNINGMYKYVVSIAGVGIAIGTSGTYLWKKLIGF